MRKFIRSLTGAAMLAGLAQVARAADPPKAIEVRAVHPVRGEIIRFVTLPGTIRANQQVTLYAKVAGYLKTLSVDKGDSVRAGQSLGEIEVPELLADEAKFRAETKVAETDYQRTSTALKRSPDLITPQSVDEAKGRLDIAAANLQRTETLLNYAKITAPFAGIVTARFIDPGAFVPSATSGSAAQTAAIVTIADFNTVRAQVAIPEMEASLVRVGQAVNVTTDSLAGKSFQSAVSRFSYALDDATKTMLVEADIANGDMQLRPGMYATVKVGIEKHDHALLIPVECVVMEKVNAFAFTVVDGKAKKTSVKLGFNDGAHAEVLSGLVEGDQVVLAARQPPPDGAALIVTEAK